MPTRLAIRPADLRGAARLATDATAGLTDLVEAMHERIARVPLVGRAAPDGRVGGISGLVYRSVRGITRLVGGSLDTLLGAIGAALPAGDTTPEREAFVAALNGVLGDHLAATANPLAIEMTLRREGRALELERDALATRLPHAGGRIVVLLHGFARLMERLVEQWPQPLERLVLLGHSMGGLVARSALHTAREAGMRWPQRVDDLVCLGTPHHGAPLERAGHGVDLVLGAAPYAAPLARLGQVRSAGITDLRHGNLLDQDWNGHDRFARTGDRRRAVPLPAGVHCYAVAATTGARHGDAKDRLLGDGLVPLASALGRHARPRRTLAFSPERQWIGYRMGHLDLLGRHEVYAQLRRWLA